MHAYVITNVSNVSLSGCDGDRFSLRVIVAIHCVDAEQHANAKQHNGQHRHHRNDTHPDRHREEADAVVVVAEHVVLDAECLHLTPC